MQSNSQLHIEYYGGKYKGGDKIPLKIGARK
jgi:hypothetical protein